MEQVALEAPRSQRNDALLVFIDLPNAVYRSSSELMYQRENLAGNFAKFPLHKLSEIIAERFGDVADEIEAHLYSQHVNIETVRQGLRSMAKQTGFRFVTPSSLSVSNTSRKDVDHLIINNMWRLTTRLAFNYARGTPQNSSNEPRTGIIDIVLVSGDGDYYQTFVDIAENLERFHMHVNFHIIGWSGTIHQVYSRSALVKSITHLDDLHFV